MKMKRTRVCETVLSHARHRYTRTCHMHLSRFVLSLPLALFHTHTQTHTPVSVCSLSPSLFFFLSLSHTHTHTHTPESLCSLSLSLSLFLYLSLSLSFTRAGTLSLLCSSPTCCLTMAHRHGTKPCMGSVPVTHLVRYCLRSSGDAPENSPRN